MKATYATEAIGTFFLVLTVGLTVLSGTALAPLAIGSALMVMVYMGGHLSGGHYNPAVTLAVWMRGKLPAREVAPYWAAQLVGAVLAALAVYVITGRTFAPAPASDAGAGRALLVEFLFTFALAIVVLNAATSRQTEGNSYYGLAIGFTVLVGAFAGGGISGGAFNPAVGIGPALVDATLGGGTLRHTWLYLVGALGGAVAAAALFRLQNPEETVQAIPAPPPGEGIARAGDFVPPLPGAGAGAGARK
jgi:aquaporin Z